MEPISTLKYFMANRPEYVNFCMTCGAYLIFLSLTQITLLFRLALWPILYLVLL